jgi:hypothetical protein
MSTLFALMSRCSTPRACTTASTSASFTPTAATSAGRRRGGEHSRAAGRPGACAMAMYGGLGLRCVVVEARQRRMVEGLEQLRLAREAEGVVGVVGPEELQDDVVAGAAVHREVRVRLGAGARQPDQLVAAIDPRRGRAALRVRRANCRERAPQLGRGLRAVLGLERQRGASTRSRSSGASQPG